MEHIIRSLQAMVLVVAAVCCYALSTGLTLAAFATLTLTSAGSSADLAQAAGWLTFVAALLAGGSCSKETRPTRQNSA